MTLLGVLVEGGGWSLPSALKFLRISVQFWHFSVMHHYLHVCYVFRKYDCILANLEVVVW